MQFFVKEHSKSEEFLHCISFNLFKISSWLLIWLVNFQFLFPFYFSFLCHRAPISGTCQTATAESIASLFWAIFRTINSWCVCVNGIPRVRQIQAGLTECYTIGLQPESYPPRECLVWMLRLDVTAQYVDCINVTEAFDKGTPPLSVRCDSCLKILWMLVSHLEYNSLENLTTEDTVG